MLQNNRKHLNYLWMGAMNIIIFLLAESRTEIIFCLVWMFFSLGMANFTPKESSVQSNGTER